MVIVALVAESLSVSDFGAVKVTSASWIQSGPDCCCVLSTCFGSWSHAEGCASLKDYVASLTDSCFGEQTVLSRLPSPLLEVAEARTH